MARRTEQLVDRLLAAVDVREISLEEGLRRLERTLGEAGTITIHDLSTDTRIPKMDLTTLIARWRRMSGHLRSLRSGAGALSPADVYELCADELEARIRTHELMQETS